nr:MAG: triple gene block protein 3 [Xinjiang betaflexivirus 2]
MILKPVEWIVVGIIALFVVVVANWYSSIESSCIVIISGESVTIRGCTWGPEFIEYAKTLKVAAINLP